MLRAEASTIQSDRGRRPAITGRADPVIDHSIGVALMRLPRNLRRRRVPREEHELPTSPTLISCFHVIETMRVPSRLTS